MCGESNTVLRSRTQDRLGLSANTFVQATSQMDPASQGSEAISLGRRVTQSG